MQELPKVFKRVDMITVTEFANRLGCSRRQAYRLVELGPAGGGVLAFRFGRRNGMRVPVAEVERLRRACRVEDEDEQQAVV